MRTQCLISCLLAVVAAPVTVADDLDVERLTWAGVKVSTAQATVFIDAVGTDLWDGDAPQGLVPVIADTPRRYALITHAHNDHFDVEALKTVLGERGYVICHEDIAAYVASRGLKVIPARPYVPVTRAGFGFIALPAADGFGDLQVSWLIRHGETRLFHGGDTLWHGQWETFGAQYGPIDVAFLPINGARTDMRLTTGAVLSPAQALDAAVLLRAKTVVPIHYGLNDPPHYVEVADPLKAFLEGADAKRISVQALRPGETLLWPSR